MADTDIWCLDKRTGKIRKADASLGDGFLVFQNEKGDGRLVVLNNGMQYPVIPSEFGELMRPEHCPHGGRSSYHGECLYDPQDCDSCPMKNQGKQVVDTVLGDIPAAVYAQMPPEERPPMSRMEIK